MKMELNQAPIYGVLTLRLSHGNDYLDWEISSYAPRSSPTGDVTELSDARHFQEINQFWASLPDDRQAKIWDLYKEMRKVFDDFREVYSIQRKLQRLVKELYALMPLSEVSYWRRFHSRIRIPSTIKQQYGPDDPPERTYIQSDYGELVDLAVCLRAMVPIWAAYIETTKRETGNVHKEYMALGLLQQSNLMEDEFVGDRPSPMARLRDFVEAVVRHNQDKGPSATTIMAGIGSTELPLVILAQTVVRRLAISEINVSDDSVNIITNVFNFVANQIKQMDKKIGTKIFGGKVNEKSPPKASSVDEANDSIVEMYKVKQEVSDGKLVMINVYTEQPETMALKIEPALDPEKLHRCLYAVRELDSQGIQAHHTTMAQWILATCLPARGIPLLTKPSLLRSLAVAQAILWHWGFYDLAVLTTATPLTSQRGEMLGLLESRSRIPKEHLETLQVLYPYYQTQRGKQTTMRQQNVAARAIDGFCELIANSDWQLHAPEELIALSSRVPNTKKLIVPADIRAQLAKLIIHLAQ